jgi:hypothetical protein
LVISVFNVVISVSPVAREGTIPVTGMAGVKRDGPFCLCPLSQTTDDQKVASAMPDEASATKGLRLLNPVTPCIAEGFRERRAILPGVARVNPAS